MLRIAVAAGLLALAVPALAQQPPPRPGPIASSAVGPWEAVVWGIGKRVHFCTLVRVKQPAGAPSYGVLVDQRGRLFSVETDRWTLTNAPAEAVVKPASGAERKLVTRPVSEKRANIELNDAPDVLADFQKSEHADVRIGDVTVRLALDDFNAARVVLEFCAQQIGNDMPETKAK